MESISPKAVIADPLVEDLTPCPCNDGRYSCPVAPASPPWILVSNFFKKEKKFLMIQVFFLRLLVEIVFIISRVEVFRIGL